MISDKRQKIVQFADNYVEAYFNDGSILSWSKGTICYFSSRGIRSTLNLSQVKQSADLTNKLNTIIDRQNRFNDEFFQSHIVSNTLEFIYKKYRIKEYRWDQGQVQIHKNEGYVVKSDDLNAEVELDMDLYTVRVTYLQLCSGKAVRNSQNHNFTATLLQKYNYKYVEFPQENKCEIEYEYLKQTKQFSIFNLPARWYAPIKKLWAYILVNKLVDYEFCHIDFDEQGIADQFVSSKMPPCVKISDWEQQCRQDLMPLAKYGHPSNNYKWKWFAVETPSGCVVAQAGEENIMSDGIGFWFVEVSTFIYKKKNQVPKDFSFYEQVIPLIIRFQDEVERDIKAELIAFLNYTRHNMTAGNNQMHPVETKIVSNELIASQVQGSGVFKAYANGMVIGKFTDKVILTMQGTDIKIISALGQSYFTTAGSEKQRGSVKDIYSQHIALVSDYYERIFYPEQWQHRMNLNQHLEEVIRSNKVSIAVCQLYKG